MTGPAPLVLLPGHMADEGLWDHPLRHLAATVPVTVADLSRHDSLAAMAGAVLATAPDRFALAGFSMGGYLAFEILRQAPGRVSRLALLDTSARPDTPEQRERRHRFMAMGERGELNQVMDAYMPIFVHPDRLADAALVGGLMAMAHRVGRDGFLNQQKAMLGRPDSRGDLGRIAVPTLVACGRQDALTPPELHAEMAAGIPGARLVVIEDSGHMTPLERPQAVTALLQYWLQD
ncbi:pimeloyl-ACP methyl ester carboxylesterase [Stella humosa]|uniref:Pimeloyl-ACP methyl ester carboxylesterase n=1 Tax=Stella humosa TaxID=94 RepID=A0A3N1KTR9_9PROT|nr:alpha/beta fold hydrolase [Stella humosa]ROP83981.1 pimeloyl-ACP methyl ester carboxylesterase [Stella humosa]BBK33490.1 alpha/beta hydrolase [Stella humosa]